MKLGIAQWCLDKSDVESLYRASEFNLSLIHIDAGCLGEKNCLENESLRKEYCRAINLTGVKVGAIALNQLNDLAIVGKNKDSSFRENFYLLKIAIDAAMEFKTPLVFLPSFGESEIHDSSELDHTAQFIRLACDYAIPKSIQIASENSLDLSHNISLHEKVNKKNFCILMDTQNPTLWNHSPSILIRGLWNIMSKQIHFKDGLNGIMANALLGRGDAEIINTVKTLKSLDFNGCIILENEYYENFENSLLQDISTVHELFS